MKQIAELSPGILIKDDELYYTLPASAGYLSDMADLDNNKEAAKWLENYWKRANQPSEGE